MTDTLKKHRLRPGKYDEVSLVDAGANQESHVVLIKRDVSKANQADGGAPAKKAPALKMSRKKVKLTAPAKKKKKSTSPPKKKSSNPFGVNLTPAQKKMLSDDERAQRNKRHNRQARAKKKSESERGENWKEERHKRAPSGSPAGGEWAVTSSESKRKYGRGGTTAADLKNKGRHKRTKKESKFDRTHSAAVADLASAKGDLGKAAKLEAKIAALKAAGKTEEAKHLMDDLRIYRQNARKKQDRAGRPGRAGRAGRAGRSQRNAAGRQGRAGRKGREGRAGRAGRKPRSGMDNAKSRKNLEAKKPPTQLSAKQRLAAANSFFSKKEVRKALSLC